MNDQELVEAAAKAYGITIEYWQTDGNGVNVAYYTDNMGVRRGFQPLHENQITDCMGDALRLAVKLELVIASKKSRGYTMVARGDLGSFYEPIGIYPDADMRRAIVVAASLPTSPGVASCA